MICSRLALLGRIRSRGECVHGANALMGRMRSWGECLHRANALMGRWGECVPGANVFMGRMRPRGGCAHWANAFIVRSRGKCVHHACIGRIIVSKSNINMALLLESLILIVIDSDSNSQMFFCLETVSLRVIPKWYYFYKHCFWK